MPEPRSSSEADLRTRDEAYLAANQGKSLARGHVVGETFDPIPAGFQIFVAPRYEVMTRGNLPRRNGPVIVRKGADGRPYLLYVRDGRVLSHWELSDDRIQFLLNPPPPPPPPDPRETALRRADKDMQARAGQDAGWGFRVNERFREQLRGRRIVDEAVDDGYRVYVVADGERRLLVVERLGRVFSAERLPDGTDRIRRPQGPTPLPSVLPER